MCNDLPSADAVRSRACIRDTVKPNKLNYLRGLVGRFATAALTALTVALAPIDASAQEGSGTVEGRVQNAVTGAALNNARVAVKGTNQVEQTDEAGRYTLSGLPAGPVTLRVTFAGLDDQEVTVTVPAGQTVSQDVEMTSKALYGDTDAIKLNEFVVQSTRETNARAIAVNEQRAANNIISVVSTDEFGTVVDRNPGEFLKMLPGVDVDYFANNITGVSVRGLGSVNTEINFDGMPVASANAEAEGRGFEIQYASAADIARVEVRKLPLPEDSANNIGGSVNLVRKSAFEQSKRRISYRVAFMSDGEKLTFDKMDGPKDHLRDRWRPNWEIAWIEPVNKNFGFAVTFGQNDTLVNTHFSLPRWNRGNAAGNTSGLAARNAGQTFDVRPSVYFPSESAPLNHNAPKMQGKDYASVRLDWRPRRELTIGFALGATRGWVQNADDIRYTWNSFQGGSGDVATFVGVDPSRGFNDYTTVGRVNGAAAFHDSPLWRDVETPTISSLIDIRWRKGKWTAGAKVSHSDSKYTYKDMENGFFRSTTVSNVDGLINIPQTGIGVGTANPIPLMMTITGGEAYWAPRNITTNTTATGLASTNAADYNTPIDWSRNANIRIGGTGARPGRAKDIISAAKLFVKRDFSTVNPLSVQLGFDAVERFRSRRYGSLAWRFVGADGLPMTADDSGTLIAANNLKARRDSIYDYPAIERISMQKMYDLYKSNPNWFQFDEERTARLNITQTAAYKLEEKTIAPYIQSELGLFRNRLRLAGGVRYEKTTAEARGLRTNNANAYLKYADGTTARIQDRDALGNLTVVNLGTTTNVNYQLTSPNVVAATRPTATSNVPVFNATIQAAGNALRAAGRTTDTNTNLGRGTIAHTQAVYTDLGARGEGENDNFFPSLHASFDVTSNIVVQGGYAKTQAKNRFERTVIPSNEIIDTPQASGALGRINVRNPDLKPWEADNFELRTSYYTKNGGNFGLGVYRKKIQNYQIQDESEPLSADDIANQVARFESGATVALNPDWDIGAEHLGYEVSVFYNEGSAQLDGAELEFRQSLDPWVPTWARGFAIRGTSAYNNLKGRPGGGDVSGIRDWRHTAGLGYSRSRFSINVNYNMNGSRVNNIVTSNGFSAEQLILPQHMWDLNVEVRIAKWANLFFAGRNITDERFVRENQYAESPQFTWLDQSSTQGVTFAVGISGSF